MQRWTVLPFTASVAIGARAVITGTLPSTTSSIGHCLQLRFPPDLSPQASIAQMGNAPMVSQWCPGGGASCWCGMLLVPTLSHPPTLLWPRSKQGPWLPRPEAGKCQIYSHLDPNHLFEPVAIETSGAFGPSTRLFLEELGGRLKRVMGEANARSYLYQRLPMAVQRGNAASIMGTISPSSDLADFF